MWLTIAASVLSLEIGIIGAHTRIGKPAIRQALVNWQVLAVSPSALDMDQSCAHMTVPELLEKAPPFDAVFFVSSVVTPYGQDMLTDMHPKTTIHELDSCSDAITK